jgi:hypothetical protein
MRRESDVLISVAEAAGLLKVDPATIWRYINRQALTPARPEKPWMLWQSDVLAFERPKRGPKPRATG